MTQTTLWIIFNYVLKCAFINWNKYFFHIAPCIFIHVVKLHWHTGNEGVNSPPLQVGGLVHLETGSGFQLTSPYWQMSLYHWPWPANDLCERGFHSERDMDDPDGPGSSLLGATMNASRTESAESAGSSRDQLLLEVLVILMCVFAVTGTNLS